MGRCSQIGQWTTSAHQKRLIVIVCLVVVGV